MFEPKNQREIDKDTTTFCGAWVQARYLVVFAAFLVNAVCFIMRVNLSVAIVAISQDRNETITFNKHGPNYKWDASTRGIILSSYFWGSFLTQIPTSYLVHRYGPRIVIFITLLICTAVTFLFVPAAALGWQYACASRVILGLAQGAVVPACHTVLSRWSPIHERARMAVYMYSGDIFGAGVALSMSGFLSNTNMGWPLVFYASSAMGLFSAGIWLSLAADSPAQHPLASPRERRYIAETINANTGATNHNTNEILRVPWLKILTSAPMLALTIAHSVQAWGFWTLLIEIPSYMRGVYKINLPKNGLLSSLPYVAMWIAGLTFSWVADWMIKHGTWSIGTSRKVGNSIGQYGSALALVVLGYVGTNKAMSLVILILSVALNAGVLIGFQVNHIDLSPNFAGPTIAFTHSISSVMGTLGCLYGGYVVTENDNVEQWRTVFLVSAALFFIGNTIFIIFASGEVQPWNEIKSADANNETEKK